jgi:molybdenum-dependent DNA-binding transcriptional regulator ModE
VSVISDFISKVQSIHATGNAAKYSYRSAFEALVTALPQTFNNHLGFERGLW